LARTRVTRTTHSLEEAEAPPKRSACGCGSDRGAVTTIPSIATGCGCSSSCQATSSLAKKSKRARAQAAPPQNTTAMSATAATRCRPVR